MRMGLVVYGSLDTPSGGFLYDRKLVGRLQARGYQVEVISLPWRSYARNLMDNWSGRLFERLRDFGVDLLIQDELNHPSLFALNARLRHEGRTPIVSVVHHLRSSERHPAALKAFYAAVERRYLASVDAFIFNSQTTKGVVEEMLGASKPNVVAQPGADRLGRGITPAQIRKRVQRGGPLRMVFVGSVIRRKGLEVVVEAMGKLPKGSVELDVAGSLDAEPETVRKVRAAIRREGLDDQVRLLGHQEDAALAKLMKASDVLVVPSEYEGYGIVYAEGMRFGLPALGGKSGAAGEVIRDGVDGFLIEAGDAPALTAHLKALVEDRELLEQMSLAAQKAGKRHAGWETSMDVAADFLEGIALRPL
ncbi:MAG: glycosyltransferase family 1 protein [Chloroflexi bacterium]|nr:glycosyltransferase family 1 protein [Chloroflexota bacterium]